MSQNNHLQDAEEAEDIGVIPTTVTLGGPAVPDPLHIPDLNQDALRDIQYGENDLEAPIATDPVYSAFSTWKKRYM